MQFETYTPGRPLNRFVDHFWFVASEDVRFPRQTLFPDGGVTILFNLAAPHSLIERSTGTKHTYCSAWIAGERESPYLLETPDTTRIAGIRFLPGGAYPFLPAPVEELTGRVIDLDEVFGPSINEFVERMGSARTTAQRFDVMERFLERYLRSDRFTGNPLVERAVQLGRRLGPSSSIVKLAGDLGVSHRHLLREFDRWVGLKPKMLQRILRFQRVISLEERKTELDWTTAAYDCGYYDQAHLIRDFRTFTGITPTRYSKLRLEYPNYVPEI